MFALIINYTTKISDKAVFHFGRRFVREELTEILANRISVLRQTFLNFRIFEIKKKKKNSTDWKL